MDRLFAYAGAIPQDTDVLSTNKNVLYGLGHMIQAALGTTTSVVGLVGAQSTIPDLHITIGPGAIYSSQTVDATAYGDLGTDANTVMKQGILKAAQTLTLTAPITSGYSQVYLVEATYSDTDGGATVLPYYNSSNPAAPYAGPANAGTSNYTVRQGLCTITLKAGAAAPTGSQTTPATDPGYVPLYTVTLANGQTAITTAQIITASGAPFVPYNLNNIPTTFLKLIGGTLTGFLTLNADPTMALHAVTKQYVDNNYQAKGNVLVAISAAGLTNWTVPAGVTVLKKVRLWSPGGGGGGSYASAGAGASGATGAFVEQENLAVTPGQVIPVTIGAPGVGGAGGASCTAGGAGGTTSFGSYFSATGGLGGNYGSGAVCSTSTAGGTPTGGSFSLNGQSGSFGFQFGSTTAGGGGPGAPFGTGPAPFNVQFTGSNGTFPGGGGSAGSNSYGGGVGGGGLVLIEY